MLSFHYCLMRNLKIRKLKEGRVIIPFVLVTINLNHMKGAQLLATASLLGHLYSFSYKYLLHLDRHPTSQLLSKYLLVHSVPYKIQINLVLKTYRKLTKTLKI